MKLTKEQKAELKAIKQGWAKDVGLNFITIDGVVTIGWARIFTGSKMVAVTTSYYDEDETDRFRRKTGEFFCAIRMSEGNEQMMQLPLGHMSDEDITLTLSAMFYL